MGASLGSLVTQCDALCPAGPQSVGIASLPASEFSSSLELLFFNLECKVLSNQFMEQYHYWPLPDPSLVLSVYSLLPAYLIPSPVPP